MPAFAGMTGGWSLVSTCNTIDLAEEVMGCRLTFRLPSELAKRLEQMARDSGRNQSEVVRLALEAHLESRVSSRVPGSLKGKIKMAKDFDAPLPASIADVFAGRR